MRITAEAVEYDPVDSVDYSLINDASGLFAIDASAAVITVAAALDAESATRHDVTVESTSTDINTSSATFGSKANTVNAPVGAISDVNGNPSAITENATAEPMVHDVGNMVSDNVNDTRFNINAGGFIRVASGASFNAENMGAITPTITVSSVLSSAGNLLINPGAEQDPSVGWTEISGDWQQRSASPSPYEGLAYFFAGASGVGELIQDVDVSHLANEINEGAVQFQFSGRVSGWNSDDTARIIVEYRDSGDVVLDSYDSGPQTSTKIWLEIGDTRSAPVGTTTIRVRLIAVRNAGTNNDGYFDALILTVTSAGNLLINPGAEQDPSVGWTEISGDWQQRSASPSPYEGLAYFFAGASGVGELIQDVDVSHLANEINEGAVQFQFSGRVSGWNSDDTARIIVEYRDSGDVVLDSYDSGPQTSTKIWLEIGDTRSAPVGTTTIRVRLIAVRNAGTNNDGYFDALILVVDPNAPGGGDGFWQGITKALPTTGLGNVVAVSCHNCYNGPNNEIYNTTQANSKINYALANGADLIEIDIGEYLGVVYANHDDPLSGSYPTLAQLLDNTVLLNSEAMLFMEIKERGIDPNTFATLVLDLLNSRQAYASEGRWVFFRAFSRSLPYLIALRDALPGYPQIAPFVRFIVLYDGGPTLYNAIDNEVVANGFHGVEVRYTSDNLYAHLMYARSLGLMAGIWTVPAAFGEVAIGAMREDVDQMTMELRVDKGREFIEELNTAGYFNAWDMTQGPLTAALNLGAYNEKQVDLDRAAGTTTVHGTPSLEVLDRAASLDRFGGSMLFDLANREAVDLWDVDANANEGFLVSAVVHFDDIDLSDNAEQTMAIVSKAEAGGFVLGLTYGTAAYPNTTVLRCGVHINGSFVYHEYPMTGTNSGHGEFDRPVNDLMSYFVVCVYDGNGGVYLVVNNQLPSTQHPTATGGVTANDVPIFVGAEPQADGGSRFYFDGKVQQVSIQRWGDHFFYPLSNTIPLDQDGDGLDDAFETAIGTDPLLPDSDGDGLTDYDEVAFDGDATAYTPGQDTNPLMADTDNDLLDDGVDPLPLLFNYGDGDLAPLGSPDGVVNAADLLIAVQIVIGRIPASDLELQHGDLYPQGAPDGIIDLSDLVLLQQAVLND
ncbi:MAG: hypothetical protein ABFS24_14890 [Pseudomonadota bacterium]